MYSLSDNWTRMQEALWQEGRERGIRPLLARPMDDTHGSGLGKTRHFIETTLSWFNNHRRIRLCYERSDHSFLAFHQLAAILICHKKLVDLDSS